MTTLASLVWFVVYHHSVGVNTMQINLGARTTTGGYRNNCESCNFRSGQCSNDAGRHQEYPRDSRTRRRAGASCQELGAIHLWPRPHQEGSGAPAVGKSALAGEGHRCSFRSLLHSALVLNVYVYLYCETLCLHAKHMQPAETRL